MQNKYLVLYADDDLDDYVMIKEAFETYDHLQLVHAANGEDAFIELNQMHQNNTKPCLIILDINMPLINGREALEKIKSHQHYKDIPVVLFSTSSNQIDRICAEKLGGVLIEKPVNGSLLKEIVQKLVAKCNLEINRVK